VWPCVPQCKIVLLKIRDWSCFILKEARWVPEVVFSWYLFGIILNTIFCGPGILGNGVQGDLRGRTECRVLRAES